MYTWILVFLLCSWKIEALVLKLKDQKLQTKHRIFSCFTTDLRRHTDAILSNVALFPYSIKTKNPKGTQMGFSVIFLWCVSGCLSFYLFITRKMNIMSWCGFIYLICFLFFPRYFVLFVWASPREIVSCVKNDMVTSNKNELAMHVCYYYRSEQILRERIPFFKSQGFFMFSWAEFRPHSQWNLGVFFLKNSQSSKKSVLPNSSY